MPESIDDTLAAGGTDDTLAAGGGAEDTLAAGPDRVITGPVRRTGAQLRRGDAIGRYVVLSKLGAGGMGVVHAAYDPELDRKVAVKMLLADSSSDRSQSQGRTRLLREAQALAKFSHPEIVAIHDVGEHEAGVWIAMEFVEGRTLGAWAGESRRTWREVVAVMGAVGRGVAAAHAAGLIHRDLKPDNIMVAPDGRVRVMDFGLTRSHGDADDVDPGETVARPHHELLASPLTQIGSVLGTPAYMAPEQWAGEAVSAACDQFSCCVTMWELLYGERPFAGATMPELAKSVLSGQLRSPSDQRGVPSWLRRTLERGLARQPDRRWPSMQALLDEFTRGRTRVRVRRTIGAMTLVVAGAAGVFGWQRFDRQQRIAACEVEGEAIQMVWNESTRERVGVALRATGVGYAETTAQRVLPLLEAHAQTWQAARTTICLASSVEQRWDSALHDQASWCLEDGRLEFAAVIDRLSEVEGKGIYQAVLLASGLDPLADCLDEDVLRARPELPVEDRAQVEAVRAELAVARVGMGAGAYEQALATASAARVDAEAIDWTPLVVEARGVEADLLATRAEFVGAERLGEVAYLGAARARAWAIAAEAALNLGYLVGHRLARSEDGLLWLAHAEVAIDFAGDPLGLRRARLATQRCAVKLTASDYDGAVADCEAALAILEPSLGPDHPALTGPMGNLASAHTARGDYDEAMRLHQREREILEAAFGPDHPEVAAAIANMGNAHIGRGEFEEAGKYFAEALAALEPAVGTEHPDVALLLNNLGGINQILGRPEQAKAFLERALAIREKVLGPEHPDVAQTLSNLGNVYFGLEEDREAKGYYERALKIVEKAKGPSHPEVIASLMNLASVEHELGEYPSAKVRYLRVLSIAEETYGEDHAEVALGLGNLAKTELELDGPAAATQTLERAVRIFDAIEGEQEGEAQSRFELAKLVVERDRPRALELAKGAAAGYRTLNANDSIAEVDAWISEH